MNIEKLEPEISLTREHDIPIETPLSQEAEKINQLIDNQARLEKAIRYLSGCVASGDWQLVTRHINSILDHDETP